MKSPFQYGTLVDKESFVNRVEERKQLKELLGSGINVMLISPRRWGKSSLVKVAMDELTQEDKHIRVCFIDAFSIKTEAEFYRIFAREVISCAASTLEKRLEDVKQFLKAVSPSITLKSDPTDTLSFDLKLELEEKKCHGDTGTTRKDSSCQRHTPDCLHRRVPTTGTTTRLQKYGGKNALCLAEAATSLLLLLRKQAAYDDGHLQQFF